MRAVVQRTKMASVKVDEKTVGMIRKGLVVFLGVGEEDKETDLHYIVEKLTGLRIFEDENGKMNLSVKDVGGEILCISQFTIYGDCRKGKRPSFTAAASPGKAEELYEAFCRLLQDRGLMVARGMFGAFMQVDVANEGPVTILLDSKKQF